MQRTALVVVVVAALVSGGCLGEGFPGLSGQPERELQQLHTFQRSFDYSSSLDPNASPAANARFTEVGDGTFDVPRGTAWVEVYYAVEFEQDGTPNPDGEARSLLLELDGPSADEKATIRAGSSTEGTWRFEAPQPGVWSYHFEARGQGSLALIVHGQTPVEGS